MPAVELSTTRSVITRLRAETAAMAFAASHVDEGVSMTASIGLAMANGPDDDVENLLARGDGALYEAKRGAATKSSPRPAPEYKTPPAGGAMDALELT